MICFLLAPVGAKPPRPLCPSRLTHRRRCPFCSQTNVRFLTVNCWFSAPHFVTTKINRNKKGHPNGRPFRWISYVMDYLHFSQEKHFQTRAAKAPPTSGAAMNTQRSANAWPPAKRAGPMERAGFTVLIHPTLSHLSLLTSHFSLLISHLSL